jgi:pantetheine-phosphate adenylyltransferase
MHLDLIDRGCRLADRLIVDSSQRVKQPLFTVKAHRPAGSGEPHPQCRSDSFHGLLVDYAGAQRHCSAGIRAISDYVEELQMALMNRRLNPEVETIFMMSGEAYSFISSRLVKEVIGLGGNISGLVPPPVEVRLRHRISQQKQLER